MVGKNLEIWKKKYYLCRKFRTTMKVKWFVGRIELWEGAQVGTCNHWAPFQHPLSIHWKKVETTWKRGKTQPWRTAHLTKRKPDDIRNNGRWEREILIKIYFIERFLPKYLHMSKKSKQIFVVTSDSATSFPPNLLSHSRANNKSFPQKLQINLIFCAKSLCISNICCNFASKTITYSHKIL